MRAEGFWRAEEKVAEGRMRAEGFWRAEEKVAEGRMRAEGFWRAERPQPGTANLLIGIRANAL